MGRGREGEDFELYSVSSIGRGNNFLSRNFVLSNLQVLFSYTNTVHSNPCNLQHYLAILFFHLNGTLNLKLSFLALGNFIFNSFDISGSFIYGGTFNRVCLIFFPFLSSLWIASFWSLSLTLVHRDSRELQVF